MISEQVVKEAAKRYAKWRHGKRSSPYDSPYFNCDGDDPAMISKDRAVLADAYIAELARREAERAERAKPITPEWLESIGFKVPKPTGFFSADTSDEDVSVFFDNGKLDTVQINWSSLHHITTRGQLLDLLAALKGGET